MKPKKSIPQARKQQKRAATKRLEAIKPSRPCTDMRVFPPQRGKDVDWQKIELDYRAGIKTQRTIGAEHGLSHTAIQKRANAEGWDRDLSQRIKDKAEALVAKDAVATKVAKESERLVIEANAQLQADVIRSHRKDVIRARELVNRLLDELSALMLTPEQVEDLGNFGEMLIQADEAGQSKVVEAFLKATGLGDRADIMKKLAETLVKLVATERVIFGIGLEDGGDSVEDRLKKLLD